MSVFSCDWSNFKKVSLPSSGLTDEDIKVIPNRDISYVSTSSNITPPPEIIIWTVYALNVFFFTFVYVKPRQKVWSITIILSSLDVMYNEFHLFIDVPHQLWILTIDWIAEWHSYRKKEKKKNNALIKLILSSILTSPSSDC